MSERIQAGHEPGIIEEVIRHHDGYYRNHWDFDGRFEAQVRRELTGFAARPAPKGDGFWWAEIDGTFAGAVAIDGTEAGQGDARVRWFIVPEQFQGTGVGTRLFARAMEFCREQRFPKVYLWTFKGLIAARTLYERNGFVLTEEGSFDGWGPVLTEQKFELELD